MSLSSGKSWKEREGEREGKERKNGGREGREGERKGGKSKGKGGEIHVYHVHGSK